MSSSAVRVSKLEKGRRASAVEAAIAETLFEQKDGIVNGMIREYRGRTVTHDYLMGAVGELTALENLRQALESAQRQAAAAGEEEFK